MNQAEVLTEFQLKIGLTANSYNNRTVVFQDILFVPDNDMFRTVTSSKISEKLVDHR